MKNKYALSTVIATFFGVGFAPIAPGTFGSIMAFPLYALLTFLVSMAKGGVSSVAAPELINSLLVITLGLFFIGMWASDQYSKNIGVEDPQEIVVVGIYADICVLYTTADLRNRNYKVTIPKDCTMTLAGIDDVIFAHMKNILGVNIVDSEKEI